MSLASYEESYEELDAYVLRSVLAMLSVAAAIAGVFIYANFF
jgi:hypothetical protein